MQLRLAKKKTLLTTQGSRPVMHFASLLVPTKELTAVESATLITAKEAKVDATSTVADISIESIDTEILSKEDEVDSR